MHGARSPHRSARPAGDRHGAVRLRLALRRAGRADAVVSLGAAHPPARDRRLAASDRIGPRPAPGMSAGPEYAFVTAAPFIKEGAPRTSPSAVARSRTLAPVSALIELGYDARAYSLCAEHDLAGSLRDSKAIVLGDSLAGEDNGEWCYAELLAGVAAIIDLAPQLQRLGREIPLALRCLCAAGTGLDALADGLHEEDPDSLRLSIEAWSPIASAHALATCDLVLLPGQTPAQASRLIAALWAGRFAVCHSSPYYEALGEFAWVGNDLAEGIRWALSHPEAVLARLDRAQDYVGRVHAPAAVARGWIEIFRKIA